MIPHDPQFALLHGVLLALLILCLLAVGGRVYVRAYLLRTIDLGDHFMILTMLIFIPYWAVVYYSLDIGFGLSKTVIGGDLYAYNLKLYYAGEILYACMTCTLKLSIGLLLLRFATSGRMRTIVLITTVAYCFYAFGLVLMMALQCVPVARFWDDTITTGGCIPRPVFTDLVYIHAANSIITDSIYSFAPVVLIWNMRIERSIKVSLAIILSLGVIVIGVNILRLFFIGDFSDAFDMPGSSSGPYGLLGISITSTFEVGLGIVAASAVNLRPLFKVLQNNINKLHQRILGKHVADATAPTTQATRPSQAMRNHTVVSIEEWTQICITSQIDRFDREPEKVRTMRGLDISSTSNRSTAVPSDYEHFQVPKSFGDILKSV